MKIAIYFFFFFLLLSCGFLKNKETEIPFNFDRNLFFSVMLNDTIKGSFMFDTGAYGLVLDSSFDQNSGLKFFSFDPAIPEEFRLKKSISLSVSNIVYDTENTYVMDMKKSFGKECDGIIGWDLFKDKAILIDYKKKKIKVIDPTIFAADPSFSKVPLTFTNNFIYLHPEIVLDNGNKISGDFILDVGYGGCVLFTNESAKKFKIDSLISEKLYFESAWGTLYSKSQGFVFRGKSLKLAGLELQNPLLDCSLNESGILASGPYAGLLGNRTLERFDVVIDFGGKALYLKPNADHKEKMKFNLGLSFIDRTDICDGWFVNYVFKGTNSHKEGIKTGDLVTHINNNPVKEMSPADLPELFKTEDEEMLLTLNRANKTFQVKIKLKEYL